MLLQPSLYNKILGDAKYSANTIDDAVTPGIFSANDLQFGFVLQYNNDNQFQFVIKLKSGTHNLEFVKCRRRASGVWGDFIVLGQ